MKTYTFEQSLQLLRNGRKVALQGTLQSWHIELVTPEQGNLISTEPTLVRVQTDGKRIPWAQNTGDMMNGVFEIADGGHEPEHVVLDEGSCQQAIAQLKSGQPVRKQGWKEGMFLSSHNGEIYMTLPNGKMVNNGSQEFPREFHHDTFDINGRWEVCPTPVAA